MNVVFMHIATLNNYKDLVNDVVSKINSDLIDHVDNVFLCYVGSAPTIDYGNKYNNLHLSTSLNDFEFPTLTYLRNFCNTMSANVLYIHTKGISTPDNKCIEDWRNYMLYFVVEKFAICLDALKTHDSCGVDLRDDPVLHYSGNFWWSKSSYIKTLPVFSDMPVVLSERHKAEFWICSGGGSHKSLWDSNINQYQRHLHRYPEEKYKA